jgi:hypothetical protein
MTSRKVKPLFAALLFALALSAQAGAVTTETLAARIRERQQMLDASYTRQQWVLVGAITELRDQYAMAADAGSTITSTSTSTKKANHRGTETPR